MSVASGKLPRSRMIFILLETYYTTVVSHAVRVCVSHTHVFVVAVVVTSPASSWRGVTWLRIAVTQRLTAGLSRWPPGARRVWADPRCELQSPGRSRARIPVCLSLPWQPQPLHLVNNTKCSPNKFGRVVSGTRPTARTHTGNLLTGACTTQGCCLPSSMNWTRKVCSTDTMRWSRSCGLTTATAGLSVPLAYDPCETGSFTA